MQKRSFAAIRSTPIKPTLVYVYNDDEVGDLATGLTTIDGAPLENPFPGPPDGKIRFQAQNGNYRVRVVGPGFDFEEFAQFLDSADVLAVGEAADEAILAAAEATAAAQEATEILADTIKGETFESADEDVMAIGVDDNDKAAIIIKSSGDVVAAGISITETDERLAVVEAINTPFEDPRFVAGIIGDDGTAPVMFDGDGNSYFGAMAMETRDFNDEDLRAVPVVWDSSGNLAISLDGVSGEMISWTDGSTLNGPGIVQRLGARGTVLKAILGSDGVYRYTSDLSGGNRILRRPFGDNLVHMMDLPDPVEVYISYGQSWRVLDYPGGRGLFGDMPMEQMVTLWQDGNRVAVTPGVGQFGWSGNLNDLANVHSDLNFSLGRVAVTTVLRYRDAHKLRKLVIAEFCHAYGGSTWDGGQAPGGLKPGGVPWERGLDLIQALNANLASYGKTPVYRSVGWTQGGDSFKDVAGNESDLIAMMAAYDGLDLPGTDITPLNFYIGLWGGNTVYVEISDGMQAWLNVCRANANGRSWMIGPWYWARFRGNPPNETDTIHLDNYSTARLGEMEGYARFVVEDLGLSWNPLWVAETAPLTLNGNVVTVLLERPPGPSFVTAELTFDTMTIEEAEDYGIVVYVNGTRDTGITVAIGGLLRDRLLITLSSMPVTSDEIEVSYCWRDGIAQATEKKHSGLWGNIKMRGATSILNPQWTMDAWLIPFLETIIA